MEKMKTLTIQGTTFEIIDEEARSNIAKLSNTNVDYNQNDPMAADYIKNRPFYENIIYSDFHNENIQNTPIVKENGCYAYDLGVGHITFPDEIEGTTYSIVFDGVQYFCKRVGTRTYDTAYGLAIGNTMLLNNITIGNGINNLEVVDTGEPFVIWDQQYYDPCLWIVCKDGGEHTIKISEVDTELKQIDSKFLHTPNWSATEGESGYIKNRTHYIEHKQVDVVNEFSSEWVYSGSRYRPTNPPTPTQNLIPDAFYKVVFDGVEYKMQAKRTYYNKDYSVYLGNPKFSYNMNMPSDDIDTGEPVLVLNDCSNSNAPTWEYRCDSSGNHTLSITLCKIIHTIEPEFLPDSTIHLTTNGGIATATKWYYGIVGTIGDNVVTYDEGKKIVERFSRGADVILHNYTSSSSIQAKVLFMIDTYYSKTIKAIAFASSTEATPTLITIVAGS